MLLVVDIGNSNIVMGLLKTRGTIGQVMRLSTDTHRTKDEYIFFLRQYLEGSGTTLPLEGAALASVVPELTEVFSSAVKAVFGVSPLKVTSHTKTGISIQTDDPSILGADFICAAAGTAAHYPLPAIVVDMGTATKLFMLGKDHSFLGASIMPGVKISLDALSSRAAQLPYISLQDHPPVIGTNTVDSMRSGVIYGAASMVDGMIDRFEEVAEPAASLIATGGLAKSIVSHCRRPVLFDSDLLLKGLASIYQQNH